VRRKPGALSRAAVRRPTALAVVALLGLAACSTGPRPRLSERAAAGSALTPQSRPLQGVPGKASTDPSTTAARPADSHPGDGGPTSGATPRTDSTTSTTVPAPPPPPAPPRPTDVVVDGIACSALGVPGITAQGVLVICSATARDGSPYQVPRWRAP
jgi:hypothetical protein